MFDGSTALIDAVIAITLLETLLLVSYKRYTGRGMGLRELAPNVGAGLALMLALRAVLSAAAWGWVAAALLLAGLLHLADLRLRWPQRS